jgi:hypothetical protein
MRRALPVGSANVSIQGLDMLIWTDVYASRTITAAGGYVAEVGGITLTLATSARFGTVTIKALAVPVTVVDAAGALFDAASASLILSVLDEQVTLNWSGSDTSWLVGG